MKSIMLIFLIVLSGCATLEERGADKEAVLDMTHTWFNYLDQFDYEKLWEISSDLRKLKTSKEDFIRIVRGIREPLGEALDRDLQLNQRRTLIKHFPDGKYRKVVYWSKYKNKNFVREYFLLIKEGDQWRVLRYDFM